MKNQGVCKGIVSTELEGIRQCEIITIRGNRVRPGKVHWKLIGSSQYSA